MKKIVQILLLVTFCLGGSTTLFAKAGRTIKVLAIGNSFSCDAVEQNLHQIAAADGMTLVIGNMYIGGCSIDTHAENIVSDAPEYRYLKIHANGSKEIIPSFSLSQAIRDEEWDVVTVQQASHFSGKPESYAKLGEMVSWIRANAPGARILFQQTWAYSPDSNHWAFHMYGSDQQKMYEAIVSAVRQECPKAGIDGIIPSGTAIQIARSMSGDPDYTRDGFHMDLGKGRYTIACAWYETLSGRNVRTNSYLPDGSEEGTAPVSRKEVRIARKAAHKACRTFKQSF